jgi:hypothetical protein
MRQRGWTPARSQHHADSPVNWMNGLYRDLICKVRLKSKASVHCQNENGRVVKLFHTR